MRRNAWQIYQEVLAAARQAGFAGQEATVVEGLLRLDRKAFGSFAEALRLDPKYLRYDLLPITKLPEVLREALRQGLPLREAHRLYRLLRRGVLTLADLEGKPPRALAALPYFQGDFPLETPVWLFPPEPRGSEALSPAVARALVLLYTQVGELVLDPMAGYGTVVEVARALGRRAWGGDIVPLSPLVEQADIADLPAHFRQEAALLVLHPPTFAFWSEAEGQGLDPEECYGAYVGYLIDRIHHALPAIRPGGRLALVVRPRKEISLKEAARGRDFFLSPVERALAEADGARPLRYHLAVSQDGCQDWHVFVAEVCGGQTEQANLQRAGDGETYEVHPLD
ncbi:DNA methyltransferase [Meiothermus sp.]|jgi:hypothetical protein|uniref:DNA methyltransferase n=1 Tax=Meiothermus sp. TaxID=1955249 RepID=UPI0021DEE775|nr:DNA methyltransferase [Meiothermus sp.]GIW24152.1 MAG: hypothetical protein KatS3mg069_0419 [Meiothermus sp.]